MTTERTHPAVRFILLAIAGLWAFGWLPNLFLMLESGRVVNETLTNVLRSTYLSHWTSTVIGAITILALLSAIFMASRKPAVSGWYPIVLLAPWVVIYFGHFVFHNGGFDYREIMYPLFIVAVYLARPQVSDICRFIGRLAVITACICLAMAITTQSIAFMPRQWNEGKAPIISDSILAGPYAHSNQTGTALTLTLPLIYAAFSGWRRTVCIALVVVTVLWSTSRTSLIALAAFALSMIVIMAVRSTAARLHLLQFGILLALFAAVVLPMETSDAGAFSLRGSIWQLSLHYWSLSPITGWGPNILSEYNYLTLGIGGFPNHALNIWVTFAVMGGVLALIAIVAMLGLMVYRASRLYEEGEVAPLLFILLLTLMEVTEDPIRALHLAPHSSMVWGGLALVLCGVRSSKGDGEIAGDDSTHPAPTVGDHCNGGDQTVVRTGNTALLTRPLDKRDAAQSRHWTGQRRRNRPQG